MQNKASRGADGGVVAVLIGAALALVEAIVDYTMAEATAGELFGIEVTAGELRLFAILGLVIAAVTLSVAVSARGRPTRAAYGAMGALGAGGLILGGQLASLIVIVGAIVGFRSAGARRANPTLFEEPPQLDDDGCEPLEGASRYRPRPPRA